ncbi:MAG: hypothetical protein GY751_13230 [Bacteroidetes bacterium]|nr:hypothetical protein [Bacteroidota bacterium]
MDYKFMITKGLRSLTLMMLLTGLSLTQGYSQDFFERVNAFFEEYVKNGEALYSKLNHYVLKVHRF